jgi:hypothetical protein
MNGLMPVEQMGDGEIVFRVVDAMHLGRIDGWAGGFAAAISRQSRRRGWQPTEKQPEAMRRIVRDLRAPAAMELIDGEDGDAVP